MGNTGSMTSADELNEQRDAEQSVAQVFERNDGNDGIDAGEPAASQTRESAVTIPAGTVVLAATPIGNVGDASARLVAFFGTRRHRSRRRHPPPVRPGSPPRRLCERPSHRLPRPQRARQGRRLA